MEISEQLLPEFEKALLQINRVKAQEIIEKCYASEERFEQIENLIIKSLEYVGDGWENGGISLSQVYMSGVICEELIEKYLPKTQIKRIDNPKIAIAVLLDHHALGKRIVYSILRSGGYEIIDLGQGLSVDELVEKTIENKIDILLISTLMLSSALKVKTLIELLSTQDKVPKVIVGGAPFRLDKSLWANVGADADGKNASNIINTIDAIIKGGEIR